MCNDTDGFEKAMESSYFKFKRVNSLDNTFYEMKEKTLINMKHDMGKIVQGMHNNTQGIMHVNTLAQGLLETVKRMPGYEEAIAKLLEEQQKQPDANVE
jgi:hypothetical protein